MRILNNIQKRLQKLMGKNLRKKSATQLNRNVCEATRVFTPTHKKVGGSPMVLRARLSYSDGNEEQLFNVGSARLNIGRIYNNEICLRDVKVSRLHAFIVLESGEHILYDAKSRNGTYVNNIQINKHRLLDGDLIKIGDVQLRYSVVR